MYLYHAFPRPSRASINFKSHYPAAKSIFKSILSNGILCAPEVLEIYADPNTEYPKKQELLAAGRPEKRHLQSRACFTLCKAEELFEEKVRGLTPSETGPSYAPGVAKSHSDLFGPFAVAIDPISARRIGIAPTSYYSPNDVFGAKYQGGANATPGLNYQIISRLKEIREILIVLSMVEGGITKDGYTFPNNDELKSLEFKLDFDPNLMKRLSRMGRIEKKHIFKIFHLDREPAFNLVGFVDMMLNLFQQTDSSISDDILAFFQQREFRLIHHMRQGTIWYSLGDHPEFLNPLWEEKVNRINFLRDLLNKPRATPLEETYFRRCWVLESVDGISIREYIDHVIAPASEIGWVEEEMRKFDLTLDVVAAEDLGFSSGGGRSFD